jgi:hypothetical protein
LSFFAAHAQTAGLLNSKFLIIMHCAKKRGLFLLVVFFAGVIGAAAGLSCAGEWLNAGDRPQQADAIPVRSGSHTRPFQAPDAYFASARSTNSSRSCPQKISPSTT